MNHVIRNLTFGTKVRLRNGKLSVFVRSDYRGPVYFIHEGDIIPRPYHQSNWYDDRESELDIIEILS